MIYVASLHNPIPNAIDRLAERLREVFGDSVAAYQPTLDPQTAFDQSRQQYNSTVLLTELLKEFPSRTAKVIAITEVDLFIPVLTFVFGEAQLNGSVAVASSYRLRNSFYGLPEDKSLILERLEKEAVHELGHAFGLTHCDNYTCAMAASTSVEEIDLKNAALCRSCQSFLPHGPV
jgi:archaemetzincin